MQQVVSVAKNRHEAALAIRNLIEQGFDREQVGFMVNDSVAELELASDTGVSRIRRSPMGGLSGAFFGAVIGLALGVVLAVLYGLLVARGLAPAIVIDNMRTGMIFGGAFGMLLGGALGALNGIIGANNHSTLRALGLDDHEINDYIRQLRRGRVLIIVDDPDESRVGLARSLIDPAHTVKPI
ncbi:putative membrane protein [Deinobacterium chartae]|uniref:Putative membrane protein n=1 Tax=Deinobacterium chartae TaxID=521158 RepID=A0A841I0V5_9DEIO|nr:hypothetical protein [Deinobacterium chartae]MBB6097605.1 putative membrane protein [Deinobacterium chartae]